MNEVDQHDIEGRIDRLLDQLETPTLAEVEIERIQKKIAFLRSMQK